jgi:LEA14-like dessication related protein
MAMKELIIVVLGVVVAMLTVASVQVAGQKLSDQESEAMRIDWGKTVEKHVEMAKQPAFSPQ